MAPSPTHLQKRYLLPRRTMRVRDRRPQTPLSRQGRRDYAGLSLRSSYCRTARGVRPGRADEGECPHLQRKPAGEDYQAVVTIVTTTRRREATQCNIASSTPISLCLKASTSQTARSLYSSAMTRRTKRWTSPAI